MTTSEDVKIQHGLADVYFAETAITEIDGNQGRLAHRGYPIDEVISRPYEHLVYLLLEGDFPTDDQYAAFCEALSEFRNLPDDLVDLIARQTAAPADVALQTGLSFLSGRHDYPDWALISLAPSIVAVHGALRTGRDVPPPDDGSGLPADCLRRLLGRPLTDLEARIINADFVLHADHGANASAFVARVARSAQADAIRSVTAAIATFSGDRHGGAVAGVAAMLDEIGVDEVAAFARRQQQQGLPTMGFGHRVYKTEDPRARLFRGAADDLSRAAGDRSMLDKVEALVEAMKPYERFGISPNVDLYAAVVYRLLGLRNDQFTAMFAVARMAGWLAQIREQQAGSNVLIRPRLRYVGQTRDRNDRR